MRWPLKLFFCLIICVVSIPVLPQQAKAKEEGEPQMVWLNYAEGEVKFSPGHKGEPELGKDWIEANAGQVMEDGYTLVTEKGRAEIEFENGTVVYLAANSALVFNTLWVTADTTETRLNLLTGRATIAHVSDDATYVETPVVGMSFVGTQTARLESTLDGMMIHAVEGVLPLVKGPSGITTLQSGQSAAYVQGRVIPLKETEQTHEGEEWDQWVAVRLVERRALVAEGLKEARLSKPIPGLAGMVKNGKFSDCAPYGKCWEPNEIADLGGAQAAPGTTGNVQLGGGTKQRKIVVNNTMLKRCPLETWIVSTRTGVGSTVEYGTCFAGSWEHRRWVTGRHHRHSCHFVNVKHGIGIVPRHPLDVKGKPPINAKSGILVLVAQKGRLQAGVQPTPSKGIQLRANPPSGLERGLMGSAPRVAPPVIQARLVETMFSHGAPGAVRTAEQKNLTDIRYDYKSQAFVGRAGAGGNMHAEVIAQVGSGAAGVGNVQLGGHGSTGGSGGGSHGSSGGSSGGGHSGGTSSASSAASSAASSSPTSHH